MPKSDQGVSSDRYQVIPRTLIFVTQGSRVLLLKGAENKRLWAGKYNGIGGHIERGESVLDAAKRELGEEAGLRGWGLWLCGTLMVDASENTGIAIYIFRCDFDPGVTLTLQDSIEGSLEWIDYSNPVNIFHYPLVEDLYVLLPKVLLHERGEDIFFAQSFYDKNGELQVYFN